MKLHDVLSAAVFITAGSLAGRGSGSQQARGAGETMTVPALGRGMELGTLYDARTEQALGGFLWPPHAIDSFTQSSPVSRATYSFAHDDLLIHKHDVLGVDVAFALSIKSGQIKVDGSFHYLNDQKRHSRAARMSVAYRLRTRKQWLSHFDPGLRNMTFDDVLRLNERLFKATHVVTSVTWGANVVATFEKLVDDESSLQEVNTYLKTVIDLGVVSGSTEHSFDFLRNRSQLREGTRVFVHGDVIPLGEEELPTTVDEGLQYMKTVHKRLLRGPAGSSGLGVPMELTLTPITWFQDIYAPVLRRVSEAAVERTTAVLQELDESVALANDLLEARDGGCPLCLACGEAYLLEVERYRSRLTHELADAFIQRRGGGFSDDGRILDLLAAHAASPFALPRVRANVEGQLNKALALRAQLRILRSLRVAVAGRYAEFLAPTFNATLQAVYALVLVSGDAVRADTPGMASLRGFAALAKARAAPEGYSHAHCLQVWRDGRTECEEAQGFVAIHFESFCRHFCGPAVCERVQREWCPLRQMLPPPVSNASEEPADLGAPAESALCQQPETEIWQFAASASPVIAQAPPLPPKPAIKWAGGALDFEADPEDQAATLQVELGALATVRNLRVHVQWYDMHAHESGTISWARRVRVFDTRDAEPAVEVRGLLRGQKYQFRVAGRNSVGQGPFSELFPPEGWPALAIGDRPAPVILPRGGGRPPPRQPVNVGPAWRREQVTVRLSVPQPDGIARVVLRPPGAAGAAECSGLVPARKVAAGGPGGSPLPDADGQGSGEVNCTIPRLGHGPGDLNVSVDVYGAGGRPLGAGHYLALAPSREACRSWEPERPLLCNLAARGRLGCVGDCAECRFNAVTTRQFGSECRSEGLCNGPGTIWCPGASPLDGACMEADNTKPDRGCGEFCGGRLVEWLGSPACAVPCRITSVPAGVLHDCDEVPLNSSCVLRCAAGYGSTSEGRRTANFSCVDNVRHQHFDLRRGDPAVPDCQECPPGSFSRAGSGVCETCPAGRSNDGAEAECGPCPADHFGQGGECLPCPQGQFAEEGSASCHELPRGSVFTRWGSTRCGAAASRVYGGFAAGSRYERHAEARRRRRRYPHPWVGGGAFNALCLIRNPRHFSRQVASHNALIFGSEFEQGKNTQGDVACTLCAFDGAATYVRWGASDCPSGHDVLYKGNIMAAHQTHSKKEFLCIDKAREVHPDSSSANQNGNLLFHAKLLCDSLPCPPYQSQEAACAVCGVPHGGGATFVRWGSAACPDTAVLVHSGFAAGAGWDDGGSGANSLCLDRAPGQPEGLPGDHWGAGIHGTRYAPFVQGHGAARSQAEGACALCQVREPDGVYTAWGTTECGANDARHYSGYIMAPQSGESKGQFVCVDEAMEAHNLSRTGPGKAARWWNSAYRCGSLPCGPYEHDRTATCAVCSPPGSAVPFTRWGHRSCPGPYSSLIYSGIAAGSSYSDVGGGANTLCLTEAPVFPRGFGQTSHRSSAHIHGTEYEMRWNQNGDAACAVCAYGGRAVYVQWGRYSCDQGHENLYNGFVMTEYENHQKGEFVCVDLSRAVHAFSSSRNDDGKRWYYAQYSCGSLPCGPYLQNAQASCAVCGIPW